MRSLTLSLLAAACACAQSLPRPASFDRIALPCLDLAGERARQVVVDREAGQYLGQVTTVLLEDGKTLLAVYPKGHGSGGIILKRSEDGGRTWSGRLPTPASWATSREVPTLHRVLGPDGKRRLILWSGLYPARLARSEDDGRTWSELEKAGDWGGIVVMGSVEALREPGHYIALFHDDGRFFSRDPKEARRGFTLYRTFSRDGGLSWDFPQPIWNGPELQLCEPGILRSPDGRQLAVLLRENARLRNSHIILSGDEGRTWSAPRELPRALAGDRHTLKRTPDGRIVCVFRANTPASRGLDFFGGTDVDKQPRKGSPYEGDAVAWVGTWEDLVRGREGQYYVRLLDNRAGWDTTYPGVEVLPDGTVFVATYGHWEAGQEPYILSTRFRLSELDAMAKGRGR